MERFAKAASALQKSKQNVLPRSRARMERFAKAASALQKSKQNVLPRSHVPTIRFAKMANASMNVRRQNRARVGKFAYRENASPNATTIALASRMIGRVSMGDVYSAPKMLARRDRAPRERFVEKMALVLRANARRSTRVPMGCFAKMRSA